MKRTMRPGTMLSPVPAVLVSCAEGDVTNLITIAWTGIINSDPPLTYISVRKSRYSHDIILRTQEFVINLVTQEIAEKADFCGVRSGRDVDKFKKCGFTPLPSDLISAPLLQESPLNLECVVREVHEFATHDMFIAEIISVHADEELFDEDDRLCLEKAGLVAFCHGEYYPLKRYPMGKFGYSVMKPKTRKRLRREAAEKKAAKGTTVKKAAAKDAAVKKAAAKSKRKTTAQK